MRKQTLLRCIQKWRTHEGRVGEHGERGRVKVGLMNGKKAKRDRGAEGAE